MKTFKRSVNAYVRKHNGKKQIVRKHIKRVHRGDLMSNHKQFAGRPDTQDRINLNEKWEREYAGIHKPKKLMVDSRLQYFEYNHILFSVDKSKLSDERVKKLLKLPQITKISQTKLRAYKKKEFVEVPVKIELPKPDYQFPVATKQKETPNLPVIDGATGVTKIAIAKELTKEGIDADKLDLNTYWSSDLTQHENYENIMNTISPTIRSMEGLYWNRD